MTYEKWAKKQLGKPMWEVCKKLYEDNQSLRRDIKARDRALNLHMQDRRDRRRLMGLDK